MKKITKAALGAFAVVVVVGTAGCSSRDEVSYQYGYQELSSPARTLISMGWEGDEDACRQALGMADIFAGFTEKFSKADAIDGCVDGL